MLSAMAEGEITMRAIWTGSIAFGLVNIGIRVFSATEDHNVTLHQVHDADGGRIRNQRRCEICGREVKYEHVDRAYADSDQTVVITEDELKSLPTERNREVAVLEFVPSEVIDPLMLSRSYFLAPEERAVKAYHLLRRTLDETERTAIVRFTLRNKTPRLSKAEKETAATLVQSLSSDFTPEQFTDEYTDELKQLVQAKLDQGESVDTEETFGEQPEDNGEGEDKVVDLAEALRKSVDRSTKKQKSSGTSKKSGSSGSKSSTRQRAG